MKKFEKKTVYIYEINGQEKITITSPEEASRWDSIFEAAERLDSLLQENPPELKLDEAQRTDLCIYLAQNRDALLTALEASADAPPPEVNAPDTPPSEDKQSGSERDESGDKKDSAMKKQSFVQEFKRPVPPSKDGFSL